VKLVLFDIDHTLLASGGAGFRAINRAFVELFGVKDATRGIRPAGKTDPMLFEEALRNASLAGVDGRRAQAELTSLYEHYLPQEMTAPPARLMPGIEPLLETLSARPSILLGLLTGNLESTAYAKLRVFGLDRFFACGAFGSDDRDRLRLPPIALRRAERLIGSAIGLGPRVVILGDTPRDVHCALAWGATAVGVATGGSSVGELRDAGAHLVFPDLSDTPAVLAALGV
jgi:phosphoglycolate phosphatase-like HAD superfamily hydrolase